MAGYAPVINPSDINTAPSFPKKHRFDTKDKRTPGPCEYNTLTHANTTENKEIRFRRLFRPAKEKENRKGKEDSLGPGSYDLSLDVERDEMREKMRRIYKLKKEEQQQAQLRRVPVRVAREEQSMMDPVPAADRPVR